MKLMPLGTHKRYFLKRNRIAVLLFGLSVLIFPSTHANSAPPINTAQQLDNPIQFVPPPLPDRGRPGGRSSGGASRGSCDTQGQLPLTALVPITSDQAEESTAQPNAANAPPYDTVFSLTTAAIPTFWFYTPYPVNETPMTLVIQDEQNNTLYQGDVIGDQAQSGIISISLPDLTRGLETGNLYHWYFMAYCDESSPAFVQGWIERVPFNSELGQALQSTNPREQAIAYAQNGIWQEAITLLGEQYREQADNEELFEDWRSLLESAGLEAIAEQPLIDCCTP